LGVARVAGGVACRLMLTHPGGAGQFRRTGTLALCKSGPTTRARSALSRAAWPSGSRMLSGAVWDPKGSAAASRGRGRPECPSPRFGFVRSLLLSPRPEYACVSPTGVSPHFGGPRIAGLVEIHAMRGCSRCAGRSSCSRCSSADEVGPHSRVASRGAAARKASLRATRQLGCRLATLAVATSAAAVGRVEFTSGAFVATQ